MTFFRALLALTATLALGAGLAACGDSGSDQASPSPSAAAGTSASTTKEAALMKAAKPAADALAAALKKGDVAAARAAYEAYDAAWNGIEVYTNVRSRQLYGELETDLQARIAEGLAKPQPGLSELVPLAEQLARKFDEAVALSEKGPAMTPLFDDLAALRIVRADLRIVTSALTSSDAAKARTYFASFKSGVPAVYPLIKARSAAVEQEVAAAIAAADAGMQQPATTADELKPLVAAVTERYNYAVNLLNAAARNADLTKITYTEQDLAYLGALNEMQVQLRRGLAAWNAGSYGAASEAVTAARAAFDRVRPALAARGADAALSSAFDAYAALSGAAGDPATAAAANKAAVEAAGIAQQVLAGQFWTDPALQAYLASLPKT